MAETYAKQLADSGVKISEDTAAGAKDFKQWKVIFRLDDSKSEAFFLRFTGSDDLRGAADARISQQAMTKGDEGLPLRGMLKSKDIHKTSVPLASELSVALQSPILNEILTRAIIETADPIGASKDLRIHLSQKLLTLPANSLRGVTLPARDERTLETMWREQSRKLPMERPIAEDPRAAREVKKISDSIKSENARAGPAVKPTNEQTAALVAKTSKLHAEAVRWGYWLAANDDGDYVSARITASFEFAPYQAAEKRGVCAIFDPKVFPSVSTPMRLSLLDDPTIDTAGSTVGPNAMVNRANCKNDDYVLMVAHDEAAHLLIHRLGLIDPATESEAAPKALQLVQRLDAPSTFELNELVSCAAAMDIAPYEEITELLILRLEQLSGELPGRGAFPYNATIDLTIATLRKQPGAEQFKTELDLLASGLKRIEDAKSMGALAQEAERTKIVNFMETAAADSAGPFGKWISKVEKSVATQMCAEAKALVIDLNALRKGPAQKK